MLWEAGGDGGGGGKGDSDSNLSDSREQTKVRSRSWQGLESQKRPSLTCLVMDVGCWWGTLLGLSAAAFLHIPGLSFWSEFPHSPMAVFRVSISKTATQELSSIL